MHIPHIVRLICLALILPSVSVPAAAEDFPSAVRAYLQHHVDAAKINCGIVVGKS